MVSTTNVTDNYVGNGAQTLFPITMQYMALADIKVYVNNVLTAADLNSNPGYAKITPAPSNGIAVKIIRVTPLLQSLNLENTFTLLNESIESGLDRQMMIAQEQAARIAALGG